MRWFSVIEKTPTIGFYFAKYNGDHAILQVSDSGYKIILSDASIINTPSLHLIKWLEEAVRGNKTKGVVCKNCGSDNVYASTVDSCGGICDNCGYEW